MPGKESGKAKEGGIKRGTHRTLFVRPVKANKVVKRKAKIQPLRKSITPGTVLVVLAGRHRGKRVVFLKQLPKSGLLLVTGPLKLNNTPLRRIAQAFVIATSTKIDVSKVNLPDHINDDYFKRAEEKTKKSESNIFASSKSSYEVTDDRKKDQKNVDTAILQAIRAHKEKKFLFGYLGSRFTLGKNQHPHNLVF
jgi:large subunit ribosomal protein L6e|uniref:60S ribosomal protein L6 n=2 Tax=Panagrolaimus TaxID=55784 RepID=A0A914PND6_9BILA